MARTLASVKKPMKAMKVMKERNAFAGARRLRCLPKARASPSGSRQSTPYERGARVGTPGVSGRSFNIALKRHKPTVGDMFLVKCVAPFELERVGDSGLKPSRKKS